MSGFWGWFLVIVGVLAVFNAEKLPALRRLLEEKFKDSVDLAKESSKTIKDKVDKVKSDIDNRKNAVAAKDVEPEENSAEEIEDALQFMKGYVKDGESSEDVKTEEVVEAKTENTEDANKKADDFDLESIFKENAASDSASKDEDKPIDLEHRY